MGTKKAGYTILEVLLFITLSSAMFVAAMIAIDGRQEEVQFSQAVREFESKLRDYVNDVSTGYYPTNHTVGCEVNASGDVVIFSTTSQVAGANDDCVYLGKAIQLHPDGRENALRIFNMASRRFENQSQLDPPDTLEEARPTAVTEPSINNTWEDYELLFGLEVTRIIRPQAVPIDYDVVAIFSNLGVSGSGESQTLQIGGIVGSAAGLDEAAAAGVINQINENPLSATGFFDQNTDEGIVFCLEDSRGKKASVSFGARGLSTTRLNIDDYVRECDA